MLKPRVCIRYYNFRPWSSFTWALDSCLTFYQSEILFSCSVATAASCSPWDGRVCWPNVTPAQGSLERKRNGVLVKEQRVPQRPVASQRTHHLELSEREIGREREKRRKRRGRESEWCAREDKTCPANTPRSSGINIHAITRCFNLPQHCRSHTRAHMGV